MNNINELLNIDFSTVNDEFNWLNNTPTPIETIGGQLRLVPEASTSQFVRGLGILDPTNDRIRVQCNLDIFRKQTSQDNSMKVIFGVYIGSSLIDEFSLCAEDLGSGEIVTFNFDRVYYYEDLSGSISLKITTPEGYENELFLDYLKAWDGRFDETNVRSYFILDQFLEDSFGSVSSGVQLLEWKIDDVETLTADFFTDNPNVGGDPIALWKMAKADADGLNREANIVDPNTFNPFVSEWGLTFEDVAGNYFGGKPTGTATGKDYGSGILTIGFDKPEILNGSLESKKGVFFIDVDYSKNLKVVFNVLVNNTNSDVFDSPLIFRKYTINWNADICEKSFYYEDQLSETPTVKILSPEDGFLFGLTGESSTQTIIGCDESFAYDGNSGTFVFGIDFGSDVGETGINFNALSIPDKFEIEWNGITYSSGYVGSDSYDQQLINLGINPSEINTGTGGSGQLLFQKDQASPQTAVVRVTAPLSGTGWNISGICPSGTILIPPTVEINAVKSSYEIDEEVTFDVSASDADGTIASWLIEFGDQTNQSGSGTPPAQITKQYDSTGSKVVQITVTDNDGLTATDSINLNVFSNSQYQLEGITRTECGGTVMNGTLTVNSGTVVVKNNWTPVQGQDPPEVDININGTTLASDQTMILGVGVYPFNSDPMDCSLGYSINNILIL